MFSSSCQECVMNIINEEETLAWDVRHRGQCRYTQPFSTCWGQAHTITMFSTAHVRTLGYWWLVASKHAQQQNPMTAGRIWPHMTLPSVLRNEQVCARLWHACAWDTCVYVCMYKCVCVPQRDVLLGQLDKGQVKECHFTVLTLHLQRKAHRMYPNVAPREVASRGTHREWENWDTQATSISRQGTLPAGLMGGLCLETYCAFLSHRKGCPFLHHTTK